MFPVPVNIPDQKGFAPLTIALVALCVCAWLASFHISRPLGESFGYVPVWLLGRAARPAAFELVPLWLTPATSIFVHDGIVHLVANTALLWLFGRCLEYSMGTVRYGLLLAAAVYGSAVFQSIAVGGQNPVVGASGMIAAILGAFLILHPKTTIRVLFFVTRGWVLPVPAMFFLIAWWCQDLFSAFDVIFGGRADGIAHAAHLSGFLLGIGLASMLRPPNLPLFDAGKPWPKINPFVRVNPFGDAEDKPPSAARIRRQHIYDAITAYAVYAVLILLAGLCVIAVVQRIMVA